MRSKRRPVKPAKTPGQYALRLTRVFEASSVIVRCLSHRIDGLLTHYVKDRSQWCPGPEECPGPTHKIPTQWRGYVAAEEWDPETRLYYPCVFEITSSAELDMRDVYERGQTWRFTRPADVNNVAQKVTPFLLDSGSSDELREPFSMLPVLATIYFRADVKLGVSNPMPPRVMVAALPGEPPPGYARPAQESATITPDARKVREEGMERMRQKLKE